MKCSGITLNTLDTVSNGPDMPGGIRALRGNFVVFLRKKPRCTNIYRYGLNSHPGGNRYTQSNAAVAGIKDRRRPDGLLGSSAHLTTENQAVIKCWIDGATLLFQSSS